MALKEAAYRELHGTHPDHGGLTRTQRIVLWAIIIAVALAVIGTEPELPGFASEGIEAAEIGFGTLFLLEYLLRIWSIGFDSQFAGLSGRVRYMLKPLVIIDLLALLPFLMGAVGGESLLLRSVRVLRLLALSKMFRYSEAMRTVVASLSERRYELVFAMTLAGMMILLSSAALYAVEGARQPEAFGSILRAMWWSVCTLTTVGYGDVVPVTPLGKVLAAVTAIAGIGMIAMPTGILAASFSDGFAKARASRPSSTTPDAQSSEPPRANAPR